MYGNKVIFLSDLHLLKDRDAELQSCNTFSTFQYIMDDIKAHHKDVSTIFLMGDISQDGTMESYMHLKNSLLQLNNSKIHLIPGNHDNKLNLYSALKSDRILQDKIVEIGNWTFILLDTTIPPHIYGHLSDDELSFLKKSLDILTEKQVIILMHHHPFSMKTPLIDEYILKNKDDFMHIILEYINIKAIIFGHVHQALQGNIQNFTFMSCPSTCFQFIFGTKKLAIDVNTIGYRWLCLEDKYFISGVSNININ